MAKQTVNLGTMADNKSGDPLRTAFEKINENFDELYANQTGGGVTSYNDLTDKPTIPQDVSDLTDNQSLLGDGVDLTAISTDIIPSSNETYDLGSPTNRFKDLYLSGNTIDLGGTKISADQYGKVVIPGVNRKLVWASMLDDQRTEEDVYFNDTALWTVENPLDSNSFFIVDQVFYQLVYNANDWGIARSDYLSSYSYDVTEDGFITGIYVDGYDYPEASLEQVDFAELNSGEMWVIPAVYDGGPVDPSNTQLMMTIFEDVESGAQVLKAGIISDFEASTPQVNFYDLQDLPTIPQDVSDLSDNEGLLGGVSSYNDLTDKPTIPNLTPGAEGLNINGWNFVGTGTVTVALGEALPGSGVYEVSHYYQNNIHFEKSRVPADFATTVDFNWVLRVGTTLYNINTIQEWAGNPDSWEVTLTDNFQGGGPVVFEKEVGEARLEFPDNTVQTTAYIPPSYTTVTLETGVGLILGLNGADTIVLTEHPTNPPVVAESIGLNFIDRSVVGLQTLIINRTNAELGITFDEGTAQVMVMPQSVYRVINLGNNDWMVV